MNNYEKPLTLVVMAAGMGSRYGGLKQIDPVDEAGHIIMDFSVYDAVLAGFDRVVFIIKKENEQLFHEAIGDRISRQIPVTYVFQELDAIPEPFRVPEGRVKPWGTGHAVLSCMDVLDGPFAVINADDFYGRQAFALAAEFLRNREQDKEKQHYMMAGYRLGKTLTENGYVSRGVCSMDAEGYLLDIHERTHIEKRGNNGAAFTEDGGETWQELSLDTIVSMNMWGFSEGLLKELKGRFAAFLEKNLTENPLKCEFFLPFAVDEMLKEGKADVKVLPTEDQWFGVTYKEDKPVVVESIRRMEEAGLYAF